MSRITSATLALLLAVTPFGCAGRDWLDNHITPKRYMRDYVSRFYGDRVDCSWMNELRWGNIVNVAQMPAKTIDGKLVIAQKRLARDGGGVAYFPPGVYHFSRTIKLRDGIILRGADRRLRDLYHPDEGVPRTRFVFPKYQPDVARTGGDVPESGSPDAGSSGGAWSGIHLAAPATASNCGVAFIDIDHGHIYFGEGENHQAGRNRFVVGCRLQHAAVPVEEVPDAALGQPRWHRFPSRRQAAIHLYANENALVAANHLPTATDNFAMPGYVIHDRGKGKPSLTLDEVIFDYDNRRGIAVNPYVLGGIGGRDPKGTPQTHPHGFRKGIVITGNVIRSTGRTAIHFSGDGTICSGNQVFFKKDVDRWTHTGRHKASGSSTNGNRAILMSGWRWTVAFNEYRVYRNRVPGTPYYINDGEGMMHEGHANCTVKDSKVINNRGNAYLSIYKTAGIDGLLVEGNRLYLDDPGVAGNIGLIYVVSNRNWDRHYIRNVTIDRNDLSGGGIVIEGAPAENNVVSHNTHVGEGKAKFINGANASWRSGIHEVYASSEFEQIIPAYDKPLADPNRPSATAKPDQR